MIKRNLKTVEKMILASNLKGEYKDITINGVSIDSRKIEKNQLFIPIIGENFNGHKFIDKAIENGAIATLWNKNEPLPNIKFPFILVEDTLVALQQLAKEYRKELNTKVIGITGSNGKTSTKDILDGILSTKFKTQKTIGNLNNHLGVPLTILNLDEDVEMAIIEMGTSNFGEISLLTSIAKPNVAIITSIGAAHLEDLKTKENVAIAKLEILEELDPKGLFVYFGDDLILKKEVEKIDINQQVLTYGIEKFNDYEGELNISDKESISFRLKKPNTNTFFVPMLGKHNMYNTMAAIAVAKHFNIPDISIQEGLYHIDKTGMRNELIEAEGFTILNDSYKSNPDSLLVALDTFYSLNPYEQKILVLGDMQGLGEEEIAIHEDIGLQIDPNQVEYILTIGPISKHLAQAAKQNFDEDKVISCNSNDELMEQLKKVVRPKSLTLIKASRAFGLEDIVARLKKEIKF